MGKCRRGEEEGQGAWPTHKFTSLTLYLLRSQAFCGSAEQELSVQCGVCAIYQT